MQGILLIDKPSGWTSFDVVNYVRKMVALSESKKPKNIKVGHSGTLDPFATGLLILLIGKDFTRQAASFSKLDKVYEARLKLGYKSTTGDPEGEITNTASSNYSQKQIQQALDNFKGEILQKPPAYSAIKINGVRSYELARKGIEVNIEERPVTIYSNEIISYDHPYLNIRACVSSGTYIRTLVEDIGQSLGTSAYTTVLRRISIGNKNISDALTIENLNEKLLKEKLTL